MGLFQSIKNLFSGDKKMSETSLFDELGGEGAIDAAVDIFYRKVLLDDRISHFFDTVDMQNQHVKQKAFMTMAFGGPNGYTGRDMRESHKHMNLTDEHFNAVAENLVASLQELGVAQDKIDSVVAVCLSVKDDVLNK